MSKLAKFAGKEEDTFRELLAAAVARAVDEDESYAVVAVVPQRLSDEDYREVLDVAAQCVGQLVRDDDIAGCVERELIAVGLRYGDGTAAQVFASRLQGDLRMRSYHLRNTLWETGYALLPDDGTTPDELVAAAVEAARNRRRNMAGHVPQRALTIPPALGEYGRV